MDTHFCVYKPLIRTVEETKNLVASGMPKNVEKHLYFLVASEIQSREVTCPKSYNDSVAIPSTAPTGKYNALPLMQGYCHLLSTNGFQGQKRGIYFNPSGLLNYHRSTN